MHNRSFTFSVLLPACFKFDIELECVQYPVGQDIVQLPHQGHQDGLVGHGQHSVVRTMERIRYCRTDHIVQVGLGQQAYNNNKLNEVKQSEWYIGMIMRTKEIS